MRSTRGGILWLGIAAALAGGCSGSLPCTGTMTCNDPRFPCEWSDALRGYCTDKLGPGGYRAPAACNDGFHALEVAGADSRTTAYYSGYGHLAAVVSSVNTGPNLCTEGTGSFVIPTCAPMADPCAGQTTAPAVYLRRAHSFMTIPAATATGSEWFTP